MNEGESLHQIFFAENKKGKFGWRYDLYAPQFLFHLQQRHISVCFLGLLLCLVQVMNLLSDSFGLPFIILSATTEEEWTHLEC
jgi:hypothetical protein